MFPENLMQACFQQVATVYKVKDVIRSNVAVNATLLAALKRNLTNNTFIVEEHIIKQLKYTDGTNVMGKMIVFKIKKGQFLIKKKKLNLYLGIVVFCFVFGIFISQAKSESQIMFDFFVTLNDIIMRIVGLIMW